MISEEQEVFSLKELCILILSSNIDNLTQECQSNNSSNIQDQDNLNNSLSIINRLPIPKAKDILLDPPGGTGRTRCIPVT